MANVRCEREAEDIVIDVAAMMLGLQRVRAMLDILAGSELLTIMVVIALGTLVGIIPFGPVKIGPAGALFVGLAFGALDPRLGQGLDLIRPLGLALFVYTVGLASGATFFSSLRRQLPVMLARWWCWPWRPA